jgi:hypothetical protein
MGKPSYGEFSFPADFGFSGSDGKTMVRGYARGGAKKTMAKVGKVMQEFAEGELHSGSKKGPIVSNPKQALAIGYSEARRAGKKPLKKFNGGDVSAEESMQGRLPQNAAMAARQQAGRIPSPVAQPLGEAERMKMAQARVRNRRSGQTDSDVERTEEENFESVRRKYGEKPIRREKGGDVKKDKQMIAAEIRKHAEKPASKAHKGLKFGGKAVPVHSSTPKIK